MVGNRKEPAAVVSNDWFTRLDNSLVYVVPLTSRNRGLNLHVEIAAGNGGVPRDCVAPATSVLVIR